MIIFRTKLNNYFLKKRLYNYLKLKILKKKNYILLVIFRNNVKNKKKRKFKKKNEIDNYFII